MSLLSAEQCTVFSSQVESIAARKGVKDLTWMNVDVQLQECYDSIIEYCRGHDSIDSVTIDLEYKKSVAHGYTFNIEFRLWFTVTTTSTSITRSATSSIVLATGTYKKIMCPSIDVTSLVRRLCE